MLECSAVDSGASGVPFSGVKTRTDFSCSWFTLSRRFQKVSTILSYKRRLPPRLTFKNSWHF